MGQYAKGKPHGFGQYKWANESTYTGDFVEGLKSGQGKWKRKAITDARGTRCNSYEGGYVLD